MARHELDTAISSVTYDLVLALNDRRGWESWASRSDRVRWHDRIRSYVAALRILRRERDAGPVPTTVDELQAQISDRWNVEALRVQRTTAVLVELRVWCPWQVGPCVHLVAPEGEEDRIVKAAWLVFRELVRDGGGDGG